MIASFKDRSSLRFFEEGKHSKLPQHLWKRALILLDIMHAVDSLDDLKVKGFPPDLRLHKLKGDRSGTYAIDIKKTSGWRITFLFEKGFFENAKIENYH